jgi:hypothetical protein
MKYHNEKLNGDWSERKGSIPLVHFSQTATHEFLRYLWVPFAFQFIYLLSELAQEQE